MQRRVRAKDHRLSPPRREEPGEGQGRTCASSRKFASLKTSFLTFWVSEFCDRAACARATTSQIHTTAYTAQ